MEYLLGDSLLVDLTPIPLPPSLPQSRKCAGCGREGDLNPSWPASSVGYVASGALGAQGLEHGEERWIGIGFHHAHTFGIQPAHFFDVLFGLSGQLLLG